MRVLAKTADPQEALEAAQRDLVVRIIMAEFIGDLGTGIWLVAAERAAGRVVEALGGVTRHPIPVSSVNVLPVGTGTQRPGSRRH